MLPNDGEGIVSCLRSAFTGRVKAVNLLVAIFVLPWVLPGCQNRGDVYPGVDSGSSPASGDPDQFLVVDCLLPGQIRKLGQSMTYLSPRRPIRTTAINCEIRGGEYVSYDRANYATALNIWLPKAKEGDPAAQTYVGEIYEKGLGIDPDYQIAAAWYKKAADQGYTRAQINLGFLYEKGLGVPKDEVQALTLYRNASGLDESDLQFASTAEINAATRKEEQIEA